MITGLKPHSETKDSGVPWLGRIPAHWAVPRLKGLFREVDRRSGTGEEPLLSLRMREGLVDHHASGGKLIPPSALTHYKRTEPGELVMNRMRASAGLFAATPSRGLVSPDYAVLRPRRQLELRYFVHLFKTPQMMSAFRLESRGLGTGESGFLRLYTERFGMLPGLLPPLDEQQAIVRFLDQADRRIRRYIRAKQKLIALLEELKQAIIHRAVTRGLDPGVRLKPSGVAWLGDVPEHWDVVALKRACPLLRDGTHLPPPRTEVGVPLLSVRNIIAGKFVRRDDDSMISDVDYRQLCRSFVPGENDVLLAIVGATLGKVAIVPRMGEFHIQRSLAVFRTSAEKLSHAFLAAYFRAPSFQRALWTTVAFSAQPGIYLNTLANFAVVLPPVDEQNKIVSYLTEAGKNLDSPIANASREIALLREYRTRLIADVVTGKIDVRDVAASLPDEPEDVLDGPEESMGDMDADADADEEADEVEA